jgi:phosphoglucomutase
MVSWLKDNNRTVWDLFTEIYTRYGYYLNDLLDLKFEGAEGFAKMTKLMDSLRNQPPTEIGQRPVIQVIDRKTNVIKSSTGAMAGTVDGHTTNMIIFNLSDDGKTTAVVRPSGTEPKIKIYLSMYNENAKKSDLTPVIAETRTQADQLKAALQELATQLTS